MNVIMEMENRANKNLNEMNKNETVIRDVIMDNIIFPFVEKYKNIIEESMSIIPTRLLVINV
ncbi:MAG: hypothetical protein ACP5RZ_04365 [Thermoplasmata archaeon]